MAALIGLIAGAVALVVMLPRFAQKSLVADWMLAILMLCPLAICMLPLTIMLVASIFGLSRAHDALTGPLRKLDDYSQVMTQRTKQTADVVNQATIEASARLGFVHKVLGTFEEKSGIEEDGPYEP